MIQSVANINRAVRQIGMADESEYFIKVEDIADDALIVESVEMTQWRLASDDCEARVKVLALSAVNPESLIGKVATVSYLWRGVLSPVHLLITQVFEANGNGDYPGYRLTLRSLTWPMSVSQHHRVFLGQSSLDIAKTLLNDASEGRFRLQVSASSPPARDMIVQYQESDWAFLHRLLLRDGLMLHMKHDASGAELLLIDDVSQIPTVADPVELPFRSARGAAADEESISQMSQCWEQTPAQVQVRDYQFPQAESMTAQADISAEGKSGQVDFWGLNSLDQAEAKAHAERIQQALDAHHQMILVQTNCRGLKPGMAIEISGHTQLNGQYLIVEAASEGHQGAAHQSGVAALHKGFNAQLLVIPAGKPFLPKPAPRSIIATTITATIAAEVDDQGLYQVALPFAEADSQSSLPTRLMQPFGGRDHGMHFPLTQGTEVVLAFENGDIDRPTILGAVYNDLSPNPVTASNPQENLIRTRSAHEIKLDDTPGQEHIQVQTAEEKNRIRLDAASEAHRAEVVTEEGDLTVEAGKNISLQSGADLLVEVEGQQETVVKGDIALQSEEGELSWQAATDIVLTAQQNLRWVAEEGDVQQQVGGQWQVETGDGISVRVIEGDAATEVLNGNYQLDAGGDVVLSAGGSLTLTQGGGSIQIDASGNLTIAGPEVEISADKIAIKGGTVGNN